MVCGKTHLIIVLLICFAIFIFGFNVVFFNIAKLNTNGINLVESNRSSSFEAFEYIEEDSLNNSQIFSGRCVLMVIDAMRYDFAFEANVNKQNHKIRMPFLNKLLRERKAMPFKLNARPPTVTLPRIKSLVSGIIPEFIDILWNFNTTYLIEDSILQRFKENNKKIVFYGDDTWLKLFNKNEYFLRYEGVSSFIASDFDEVDLNVTRHLPFELKQTDWDLMILHYLGLDHVGHIEGPFAPINIKRKLHEMDQVISKVYSSLNSNDLLCVVSDHGMANEGGHGGSSKMETITPLVFISSGDFFNDHGLDELFQNISVYEQVDLVSTISCILNLPIPKHNKGVPFINDLLNKMKDPYLNRQILAHKCLMKNLKQLDNSLDLGDIEFNKKISNLTNKFKHDMNKNLYGNLQTLNSELELLIKERVNEIKDDNGINQTQTFYLVVIQGYIFIFLLLIAHINSKGLHSFTNLPNKVILFGCIILAVSIGSYTNHLFNSTAFESGLVILTLLVLFLNISIHLKGLYLKQMAKCLQILPAEKFFTAAAFIYLVSLFASSFIEEEHQIWYYLETTQFYLVIFWSVNKWKDAKDVVKMILLLLTTRILRSINQTGNKWIHLKDIGDLLKENESKVPLMLCAAASMITIYSIQKFSLKENKFKFGYKIWDINYLVIAAYQGITCNNLCDLATRNMIAQICYSFLCLNIVCNLVSLLKRKDSNTNIWKVHTLIAIFDCMSKYWLLFNCLIQPISNLIVLSLWQIKACLLNSTFISFKTIKESRTSTVNTGTLKTLLFYTIIGQMCYFSQGNSNSLNTIQISSGLVGINEMNMLVVGLLMFCATYAANIFWCLVMVENLLHQELELRNDQVLDMKGIFGEVIGYKSIMIATTSALCTISAFLQREHLFVWSVFAPKLIYQMAALLLELIILFGLYMIHLII